MEQQATQRELTFGERAVGLTFNPSGNPLVNQIKEQCATVIDTLNEKRESIKAGEDDGQNGERIAQLTLAIRKIQEGRMWAVNAVTI